VCGVAIPTTHFAIPLRSEKLDVDDHYIAWRQSHDSPGTEYIDGEGPFSFCSYPFLLNPRAKSKLLHTEAKFMMNHTVQQVGLRAPHLTASAPAEPMHIDQQWGGRR